MADHKPYNSDNRKAPMMCEKQAAILWNRALAQCQGADWWLSHMEKWIDAMLELSEDEL